MKATGKRDYPKKMPTSFSLNLVKMIAFSAILAIVLSLAGRQAGFVIYGWLNPFEKPHQYSTTVLPYEKRPVPQVKPAPKVVKKNMPVQKIKPVAVIQETPAPKKMTAGTKLKKKSPPANTIELHADTAKPPTIDTSGVYAIQTGVFKAQKNAEENSLAFRLKGYTPSTIILSCHDGAKVYAIRIGHFSNQAEAKTAFANFKRREKKNALLVPLYRKKDLMSFCAEKQ